MKLSEINILRNVLPSLRAVGICILAGVGLLGASDKAEAGYTCDYIGTRTPTHAVMEVIATSGGEEDYCFASLEVKTFNVPYPMQAYVTSTQVGQTTDIVVNGAYALPVGGGNIFSATCSPSSPMGGLCNGINSVGTINGVDSIHCSIQGDGTSATLPEPALPLVPVVITTTCTFNWLS